jgi:hypothetical protein
MIQSLSQHRSPNQNIANIIDVYNNSDKNEQDLSPLRNMGHRYRHGTLGKAQFITSGVLQQQQSPQMTKWGYNWDTASSI